MFLKVSYARRNKFCVQKVPKLNILQSSGPRLFKLLCDACPFVGFAFFPIYHEVCNYFLFHDPSNGTQITNFQLAYWQEELLCLSFAKQARSQHCTFSFQGENRNDIQGFLIKLTLNVNLAGLLQRDFPKLRLIFSQYC